jgi:uncharacterized protein YecT (DUF1311 family)
MKFSKILFFSLIVFSNAVFALNCQNPRSQRDLTDCSNLKSDAETKKINKVYNEYRAKLNATEKLEMKEVQLAWIKFRDLACKFESGRYSGGSMAGMVYSDCLSYMTRQRTKELQNLASNP